MSLSCLVSLLESSSISSNNLLVGKIDADNNGDDSLTTVSVYLSEKMERIFKFELLLVCLYNHNLYFYYPSEKKCRTIEDWLHEDSC